MVCSPTSLRHTILSEMGIMPRQRTEQNGSNLKLLVSMNMWGLQPEFLNILEKGFQEFLEKTDAKDLKAEYLLPTIIGGLLADGQAEVTVLQSRDKWFGVTYKEDKESVVNAIKELIESGIY